MICTLPFSIVRQLNITGISQGKQSAIRNIGYASSAKVLLNTRDRFWETEYGLKGGGSQTDLINRQVYYPSDDVAREPESVAGLKSIHGVIQEYSDIGLKGPQNQKKAGVLVGSYCWGQDARRLGALSKDQRIRAVSQAISYMHPEIEEDGMIKDAASISWDQYPNAAGAFCFLKPGDYEKYFENAISPEGNLYFAGEHCSLDNGWIQGAIISALRVLEQLVDQ